MQLSADIAADAIREGKLSPAEIAARFPTSSAAWAGPWPSTLSR